MKSFSTLAKTFFGDPDHRVDAGRRSGLVDKDDAAVDELGGQGVGLPGCVILQRLARGLPVQHLSADVALPLGVLQHRAIDETLDDGLDDHLVMVDADLPDPLVAKLA